MGTSRDPITGQKFTDGDGHARLEGAASDTDNGVIVVEQGQYDYVSVGVSSDVTLGTTGATGDFLHTLTLRKSTSLLEIYDGTTLIFDLADAFVGTLTINAKCNDYWRIKTATGMKVIATGRFT